MAETEDTSGWFDPWDRDFSRSQVPARWTNPQVRVFETPYHLTVAWGANGIGKSVMLGEVARRGLQGLLPWQTPGRPYTVILCGNTWAQLGSTLRYFWDGVEPGWFRTGIRFEGGTIKGQRLAIYDCVGGPVRGSQLRCGTFRAENLAGPRADLVLTDEPLPEDVHNELWPRLFGRDGRMVQTFTPTMKTSAKLGYLWDLTDNPDLRWAGEIHTPLSLDAVTPRGGLIDVPWTTQDEIDRFVQGLSRHEADMRMGRSRTPSIEDAYFSAWGPHLRADWTPPAGTLIAIGIDHGSKPGAQRASLVLISSRTHRARIHVLDHYRGDGRTESEEDARGILDMLRRNRIQLTDVDYWFGDRAHRGDRWGGVKSNVRLQEAIAKAIGINTARKRYRWLADLPKPLQDMRKPRKYDGSVWDGCDILHRAMVGQRFTIAKRPECNALDDDFSTWTAGFTDPAKDGIDSVRYPVVPLVDPDRMAA